VGLIRAAGLRGARGGSSRDDPDADLVARVRAGDERAFVELVSRYNSTLLRLARGYVASAAVAEEVAQDTWLAVLRGLDGFAARSSFRTWLLRILVNRARATGVREYRSTPIEDAGPAVDSGRFDSTGTWASPPQHWVEESDDRLSAASMAAPISAVLEALPQRQRAVMVLRDVNGLGSEEVCAILEISEANQRVLLHRGRSRLRQAIEAELGGS
jgi:RNA polymerase sigma-70 factor, ECF subfamily